MRAAARTVTGPNDLRDLCADLARWDWHRRAAVPVAAPHPDPLPMPEQGVGRGGARVAVRVRTWPVALPLRAPVTLFAYSAARAVPALSGARSILPGSSMKGLSLRWLPSAGTGCRPGVRLADGAGRLSSLAMRVSRMVPEAQSGRVCRKILRRGRWRHRSKLNTGGATAPVPLRERGFFEKTSETMGECERNGCIGKKNARSRHFVSSDLRKRAERPRALRVRGG